LRQRRLKVKTSVARNASVSMLFVTQSECPFEVNELQSLTISFARIVTDKHLYGNGRIFFTIDWSNPIRRSFDVLNNTCKDHFRRSNSMYPANSLDYLNLGTCNH
jgi:hypothetical protein